MCEVGGHVRALFAFQRDAVAVKESIGGGRVAAGPAAIGGDSEVGDNPGRGGNAAPVAIVSVVVNNAEMEAAALGGAEGGKRGIVGFVVPVSRLGEVDELQRPAEPGEGGAG